MGMIRQLLYDGSDFMSDLGTLVVMITSAAGALMTLYAVYIGYLFATASDEGKRKAAKDRLLKVLSSAAIVIALAVALAGINVTFNTDKISGGKFEDPTVDNVTQEEAAQKFYYINPKIQFNLKTDHNNPNSYIVNGTITFSLPSECISKVSPNGPKMGGTGSYAYLSCAITSSGLPANELTGNAAVSIMPPPYTSIAFTYQKTYSDVGEKPSKNDPLEFSCPKDSNGNPVIEFSLSFQAWDLLAGTGKGPVMTAVAYAAASSRSSSLKLI